MNEDEIENIKNIVSISIDEKFKKLNTKHKNLLKEYLSKTCVLLGKYMPFDSEYMTMSKYLQQLKQNDNRDIFSLLVLLLPYFELNTCHEITDLGELFYNLDNKSKNFKSTYYYDHKLLVKNDDDIKNYFESSLVFINRTFAISCNKLTPNWLNIFPYTMSDYKTSDIYNEFTQFWSTKSFSQYDDGDYYNFKLGYHTLYGVIKNFLFNDIKDIKWMIYDILDNDETYPNILKIVELIDIKNITNEPWDKLSDDRKKNLISIWYNLINLESNYIYFKSLILFYLRWERDNDKLDKLKIPQKCLRIIKNNIDSVYTVEENDESDFIFYFEDEDKIEYCLKEILKNLSIEDIYKYIYTCSQQFKYTWYGFNCLDETKKFVSKDDFFLKYLNDSNILDYNIKNKYYITPKMTYNFFKSLLHYQFGRKYTELSVSSSWDNLNNTYQRKLIDRLNNNENINRWFGVRGNIGRLYKLPSKSDEIDEIQQNLINKILNTKWIPQVIFECLVYNGILTYFKYNPEVTDKTLLPDKNKRKAEWEIVLLSRISLEPYKNAYHFLDNKQLGLHDGLLENVKKSKWYTNFGGDWICQIQVFHHFIHQRILFVTGATGAGKSTVFPFMVLYATKIINYNNNGKVLCTQPRKQPTKDNATFMAFELGIPIKSEKQINSDGSISNEFIKSDIDYVQYKFQGGNITDDLYHPTLKLLTDGTLYNMIKNDYVFKSRKIEESKKHRPDDENIIEPFTKNNLFDVLLIDESHEHNPYMDMILTLCKFALYINNEVTLGIVSATMDDDEPTYRKYYEPINDDWKAPLKIDLFGKKGVPYYRNILDRRVHLSVPFGGMNFDVAEKIVIEKKDKEVEIIKEILTTSKDGDILVFKPGRTEINKLVEQINNEISNSDVIAIPFMSDIDASILDIIKKIAEPQNRKKIRYDKKKYTIYDLNNIPENEKLPEGTYKRFIIVATNIAEASITIDTLKYVIDDGRQKIMYYDVNTNQSNLIVKPVSTPNQKQRKGRVGRVQPGTAYYTYDISKLAPKVIYQLCSGNINDKVLDLLSINTKENEKKSFKFTDDNNPYLISIDIESNINENKLSKIPLFLQNQYSFIMSDTSSVLFYPKNGEPENINYTDIVYPDSDGKYDINILIDKEGKFYIIHPNETALDRNMPDSLRILPETIHKLEEDKTYKNKVESIINYFKILNILNEDNIVTPYGKLITSCSQLFGMETSGIELILTILDLLSFNYSVKDKINNVFNNIIWYCVFSNLSVKINLPEYKKVYSDFLGKSDMIPSSKLNLINLDDISNNLDDELNNLDKLILNEVKKIVKVIPNYKENEDAFKDMLYNYYLIKTKIEILEELANPKSTIIYNSKDKKEKISGQINKNCQLLKNIDMNVLPKIAERDIDIIKLLNNYEQTCFFICKNMKIKLLLKMSGTPYYINYFDRNYRNIYQIKYLVSPYNKNKRKVLTNVYNEFRNNILFYLNSNDDNTITNIMWIPAKIIYLLQKINKTEIKRDNTINKELIHDIYGKDDTYSEYNILKKIDIINEYILNK